MSVAERLAAIYARIPKVEGCRVGCNDCCGPVPLIAREARAVPHIMRPTPSPHPSHGDFLTPTARCGGCAYSTPKGCSIYANRPFVCRLYAAVSDEPMLRCPHGAAAKKPLTRAQADELGLEYFAIAVEDGMQIR